MNRVLLTVPGAGWDNVAGPLALGLDQSWCKIFGPGEDEDI